MAPTAWNKVRDWEDRFRAFGFDSRRARAAALSPLDRDALLFSRLEHVPRSVRNNLSLVIDIGANEGQWLDYVLRMVPISRALVFEPNVHALKILERKFGGRPGIQLHNTALGSKQGPGLLYLTKSSDLASLLPPSDLLPQEYGAAAAVVDSVDVPIVPLDDVVEGTDTVDLMKIDVQGYEAEVLKGAAETLRRTRVLLIEANFHSHYTGDLNFSTLEGLLRSQHGFEFWDLAPPHRGVEGQALWADAVFINPKQEPDGGWLGVSGTRSE